MTHQTNAQRRVSSFMERVFRYLQEGKKEYTEAEVRLVIAGMQSEISAIEQERDQLRSEVAHWKQNHAHEVARARLLKERTDMPLERVKAYELVEELRAQLAALKDGQAGGKVVAYKVNWPGVDSVGMRRFYGADEWEASKATVEFFGGVAIPLTATTKPVPMTWQPIETAPKDGTELIGWRDDCGVILIRWTSCDAFMSEREIESSRMDEETLFQQDWFCADFIAGCRLDGSETPTHWMPLPPAPAMRKGQL